MKKNFLYSLTALFVMLFASCSQEEIVSTSGMGSNDGVVRLSVNLSDEDFYSRANQSLDVEGYVMRCICQAVDANGTLIEGFNQITSVTNGTASFEFEAPAGVANYLFWADYVEGNDYETSGSAFYRAEDLTNVGYRLNRNAELFNNQAADAFCASVSASAITSRVTLKRPFARLTIKQSRVAEMGLTGLTNIVPTINAGTNFNVATGEAQERISVRLNDGETLTALTEGDFYFFCYAFAAPATQTSNTTIIFNDGTTTNQKTVTAQASGMQALSGNVSIDMTEEQGGGDDGGDDGDDSTINVDLVIDNGYVGEEGGSTEEPGTDPTPSTEMEVGSYVNAAGEVVATAADAAGIVFAMGAIGDDVPANYPAALQGKTIKAYAVALENVAASRQQINAEAIAALTVASPVNGTQNTEALLTAINGSNFATTYSSWVTENATNGENVSSWYIPALPQLQQFMNMLFTMGETSATGSEAFRGMSEFASTNGVMFDRDPIATIYYASCTVNDQGNPSGVRINVTEGAVTNAQAAGLNVKTGVQSALCRPMFTIFE